MNIASRIRRSFFREEKRKLPIVNGSSSRNEDDLLGVTDELIDHVRSFTIDTFKNFSLYGNFESESQFDDFFSRLVNKQAVVIWGLCF